MSHIYSLVHSINETFINRCEALDPLIAENLNNAGGYIYYDIQHIKNPKLFPKTVAKINELVRTDIDANQDLRMSFLHQLFDEQTSEIIVKRWLEGRNYYITPSEYCQKISTDLRVSVFEKFLEKNKRDFIEIERIFSTIASENLEKCCELLASKTPSLQACLLVREDLSEKYMLTGLRAVSKLKTQRNPKKIDFKMLRKLGPRGRLEAMKQLMGLNRKYYYDKRPELPFNQNPTIEEFKEFLFPCSFKFNEAVVQLTKRYEEILSSKSV